MSTPLTWIEAPARAPRPNTSLDVIPVHDVSNDHFIGFQYQADPCSFPNPVPANCYIQIGTTPGTAKTFGDPANNLVTQVFGAYQGIECYLNGGIDEFEAVAERVLTNGEHWLVDAQIAGTLNTMAVATTPPSATSITGALAILEQTLAIQVPGQGYIYMSALAATYAVANTLLIRNLDGTLETYLGTPVVVITNPGITALTMYASGPINIWRGPVVTAQAPNVTINMGRALAERLYSLAIECGAWKTTYALPADQSGEPPADELVITLGSIPSSPIPNGTSTTIIAQTNVEPDAGEVTLHFSINGDPEDTRGMSQVDTLQFVYQVVGDLTGPGDTVELWATADLDGNPAESNHITIEVV